MMTFLTDTRKDQPDSNIHKRWPTDSVMEQRPDTKNILPDVTARDLRPLRSKAGGIAQVTTVIHHMYIHECMCSCRRH